MRPFNRIAYSAAHVVADPRAAIDPGCNARWTGTPPSPTASYLWSLGLGVAEAMDTAQRGMGLDWPTSLELIRRSLDAARDMPGASSPAAAAPTTWRPTTHDGRRRDPRLREQMAAIEKLGGKLIVMASRALARVAKARPTTNACTTASCRRPGSPWCCTGWATCSTRRWRATGARRHRCGHGHGAGHHRRHAPRSTASRSRCWTRTRRSPCAAAWHRACACTPATTSTTPS
jgi:hypothetical protein